jgi:uncharacterized phage-associated protein
MLVPGYDVAKAAQAVVYFAVKSGGKINVLKLTKLLYLAEREFMARHDIPMFYDNLFSMPDGPVTSITLNLINGDARDDVWSQYVAKREGYDVRPAKTFALDELDHLSKADRQILEALFDRFRDFDGFKLRDWTHDPKNVPEWEDPQGSSVPIPLSRVFSKLNKADPKGLEHDVTHHRKLARALNKCQ